MKVSKPFSISSDGNTITATITVEGEIDETIAIDVAYRALGTLAHSAGHAFEAVQHAVIKSSIDGTGAAQATASTTINNITVLVKAEATLEGVNNRAVARIIHDIADNVVDSAIADAVAPRCEQPDDLLSFLIKSGLIDHLATGRGGIKVMSMNDLFGGDDGETASPFGAFDSRRFFSRDDFDSMAGSSQRSSFHPMGGSQDNPN